MQRQIKLGTVAFRETEADPPFRKFHLKPIPLEANDDDVEDSSDDELATQVRSTYIYKQSQVSVKSLRSLMGATVFNNPKDYIEISNLLDYTSANDSDAIILDFFAGSGSTAHAVMEANARDKGARRYVVVQLPEPLDISKKDQRPSAEFLNKLSRPLNIAELTKERLRRAGKKVREDHPDTKIDTGFRVYKLATSNLKPWQPDAEDLEASILDAVDNVLPGRTEDDLLVELLLKTGIDLTLPEEKRSIAGRTVHALGGGTLMVCLGDVGANDAEALGQGMADWVDELDPVQTTVYFKDTGLGADGIRAATKANLAAILRQRLGDRIAKIASI
jgi:adenine-specific DNA-methyltransferase